MQIVTNIKPQEEQRFIYAGNAYVLKGDTLYQEIYFNGDTQLNGFFKKVFKKVGKIVGKIVKSPILGIALTLASGGAFGVLSASQLMAVNVAKGVTGVSGLINTRNSLKKQAKVDKKNAAYYDTQIKMVDTQIQTAGGTIPTDESMTALPLDVNPQATQAIQAYASYINAGGDPSKYGVTPNVTSFGISTPMLIAGGIGALGLVLIATSKR